MNIYSRNAVLLIPRVSSERLYDIILCQILFFSFWPSPVSAIECLKASTHFEKTICASAKLTAAEKSMSKAYFLLKSQLPERDQKDALIRSQRRWLKAVTEMHEDDFNEDIFDSMSEGYGSALQTLLDDRRNFLTERNGERFTALARMEKQSALIGRYPGKYTAFSSDCFVTPPTRGYSPTYTCSPILTLQKNDKICRHDSAWASGHITEVWTVVKADDSRLSLLATCKMGYASGPECPDPQSPNSQTGWTHEPGIDTPRMTDINVHPIKIDPDIDFEIDQILISCISDPQYPAQSEFIETPLKSQSRDRP